MFRRTGVAVSSGKRGGPARAASLHELASIREALRERRLAEAEALAVAEAARRRADRERTLFAATVGLVTPLRRPAALALAAGLSKRPPAPLPRQRERDDRAVLAESIGDDFNAETLLETDDALSFRRRGIGAEVVRKLRRGVWVVQAEIDLHGLRRAGARERARTFLRATAKAGIRCVRIVHGKGLGSPGGQSVLKSDMRGWLAQREEVLAFTYARAADGGHGALIVLLRAGGKARS